MNGPESWRPIPGMDGYEVSDLGRVGSWHPRNRLAKPRTERFVLSNVPDRTGYVRFKRSGHPCRAVHRLVLEAFVGPRPPGMQACHGNGIRSDNRLSNLRWDSASANSLDKRAHGTMASGDRHYLRKNPDAVRGERNPCASLSDSAVHLMRYLHVFHKATSPMLAEWFGVSSASAHKACVGSSWSHVTMVKRPPRTASEPKKHQLPKGVGFCRRTGLYRAQIWAGGKTKDLGRFETIEEAHTAHRWAVMRARKAGGK